jgi:hypothetical protein
MKQDKYTCDKCEKDITELLSEKRQPEVISIGIYNFTNKKMKQNPINFIHFCDECLDPLISMLKNYLNVKD